MSLVRPGLEYASTVWNPYTKTLKNKLEMVQRRAARFVLYRYRRTSSDGTMLENLGWQSLSERRRRASLIMFFKIHNSLVAIDMPPTLTPKLPNRLTRSENSQAYHIQGSAREYHRMAFYQRTARDWNTLQEALASGGFQEWPASMVGCSKGTPLMHER